MTSTVYFWSGWITCAVIVFYFNKIWSKGLERNLYTIPFEIFNYVYFLVAPGLNVVLGEYVQGDWFIGSPIDSMAPLMWTYAIGLLFASFGARVVRVGYSKQITNQRDFRPLILLASLGFVCSVFLAIINVFVLQNIRSNQTTTLDLSIWRYIVIEAGPYLFMWTVVAYAWKMRPQSIRLPTSLFLVAFFLICMFLNFSRGERVGLIMNILIGMQLFHVHVRRLTTVNLLTLAAIGIFAYPVVTLYKHGGLEAVSGYVEGRTLSDYQRRTTSPFAIIYGDLGRADVQAPVLMQARHGFLELARGRTYLSALTVFIPKHLRPFPDDWAKTHVGARSHLIANPDFPILHNDPSGRGESRIYGLVGEPLLNFGLWGLLPAFIVFGITARFCMIFASRPSTWEVALFVPLIAAIPVMLLVYDFDNIVFRLTMTAGFPVIIIMLNRLAQKRRLTS